MEQRNLKSALLASAAGLIAIATPAWAADQAPATATAQNPDDIIVTATRREERLQDVPVAVSAVSGQDLAKSAYREATDIQYLAPNITFSATNPVSNGGGYQIRGIGTESYDSGVEQTVGLVVDGVVIGLSRDPGATGFADIERVEVLRGPQGTLFGKNSSAGVIQIVTKKPQLGVSSLDLDLSYGERKDQLERATANVPLGSNVALRVTAFHNAQQGAIPNVVNGTHVGDRNNYGIRGKLLWEPTDKLSLLVTGEYQTGFARDGQLIESLGVNPLYNMLFNRFAVKPGHDVYIAYNDGDWTANTRLWGSSLQADYRLGDFTLTSITAYRSLKTTQLTDIDGSPADIFNHSDGGIDSNQFTQELRLTSPSGKRLEYTLGLYYYHTNNGGWTAQYGDFNFGPLFPGYGVPVVLGGGIRNNVNYVRSLAAYGQATYRIVDGVKLIGGLRYTNDRNHGELVVDKLPFPAIVSGQLPNYSGTVRADNVSGKVGLQVEPTRNVMVYATWSTGYKGPAIDGTTGTIHEVRPETVKSYEIGLKSQLFNGMLTFNTSLYWSDFTNFQAQTFDTSVTPPAFYLSNAGGMRARGVEVETSLRVSPRLRLSANGAYSDATYRQYLSTCYPGQPVSAVVGVGCYVDPTTRASVANYAGYRLPNAPEWSYNLRADFNQPLANDLTLDANANWAWRDKTQAVLGDPKSAITAYGLLNGTIGIGASDGAWHVGIYARNLLNKHFYAAYAAPAAINPGGYSKIVSPDAFRTIGGTVSFRF